MSTSRDRNSAFIGTDGNVSVTMVCAVAHKRISM